jgi:uncharacterized protein (TIGR01777 family)
MQVVVAGSSGFLGTALRRVLAEQGHDVVRLVRRPAKAPEESQWDPYANGVEQSVVDAADVVVNLAGSPTFGNPHSRKWARELEQSRVTTTAVLADAVARAGAAAPAFLAANAVGWYGDHGDQVVTEESDSRGDSFMTGVCRAWQDATRPAQDAGARVVVLRTAPVMDRDNPPLSQMALAWRLGLGARVGDGSQRFPVVSLRDWAGAVAHLATQSSYSGPANICCPGTATNAELTEALADTLHRKAFLRVPSFVVRRAAGRLAPEALGSVRAEPRALLADGYSFRDAGLHAVLEAGLHRRR